MQGRSATRWFLCYWRDRLLRMETPYDACRAMSYCTALVTSSHIPVAHESYYALNRSHTVIKQTVWERWEGRQPVVFLLLSGSSSQDDNTLWWLPGNMSHYTALVTSSRKVVVDKKPYRHAWKASVDPTYKGMVDTSTQSATPHYMGCVSLPPVFWDEWSVLGIESVLQFWKWYTTKSISKLVSLPL